MKEKLLKIFLEEGFKIIEEIEDYFIISNELFKIRYLGEKNLLQLAIKENFDRWANSIDFYMTLDIGNKNFEILLKYYIKHFLKAVSNKLDGSNPEIYKKGDSKEIEISFVSYYKDSSIATIDYIYIIRNRNWEEHDDDLISLKTTLMEQYIKSK